MEIKIIDKSDWFSYQKLRLTALKVAHESFGSTYEREVQFTEKQIIERISPNSNKFFMGIFDGKELVGMVSFHKEIGEKERHKGDIYGMFIHGDYQDKGLGKRLLSSLINKVKEDYPDLEQIRLSVVSNNISAIKLYRHLGFEKYGVEVNALKEGDKYFDEDLMVLFLK
ncbi:GNAT family N-acetyltransferase [Lactococcus lactis]|uniref:GNAT family N-acetyltransferase n=1 Tax=Lactococcus lactis TaxID=1358 RepID=UPI000349E508|nr:GNAT family N-acetyltransferase [Lactococcus lactis]ATY88382.1 GNAT family N-acetyltransferase [Lactococcus lactis subsp. lactis]ATZ01958.1 GNAT family N-acetyltransferase [Lactococcus lactis subsp. lactis]KST95812.1 acetyltransferase GNAT family [Lactococcus lactis subsp. lactis]MDU0396823.1 Spermine/spermidine acetyltransferase [Lactococcus lactis]QOK49788.1 GNAT family N-acetyltransferase [Lactococcus lactis]